LPWPLVEVQLVSLQSSCFLVTSQQTFLLYHIIGKILAHPVCNNMIAIHNIQ
jgi:hypothetical protein